jgi:hypothetical protein
MIQHSTVLVPVLWIRIETNADPDPGFDEHQAHFMDLPSQ